MKRIENFKSLAAIVVTILVAGSVNASTQDPDLTLKGDQEGTVFRSLTVEGENRVQIKFERPKLGINLDPSLAPGLVIDDALDILDRTLPDLVKPFLNTSIAMSSAYVPRPWVGVYRSGAVARFTPELDSVANWKLEIVDSRARTAMVFVGEGEPQGVLEWNGIRLDGTPAPPGYTYSYVLEARDQAGNQRRFIGDGFELPSFWHDAEEGPEFLASGTQWLASLNRRDGLSPLSLASASGINLRCEPTKPIRVIATHQSAVEAQNLATRIGKSLKPLINGDSQRIVIESHAVDGAPAAGTVRISTQ